MLAATERYLKFISLKSDKKIKGWRGIMRDMLIVLKKQLRVLQSLEAELKKINTKLEKLRKAR